MRDCLRNWLLLLGDPRPQGIWGGALRTNGEGNGTPLQYSCLENPRTEEPGGLQSMGSQRVRHDWVTSLSLLRVGEGNGSPLQCSCLESPRDGGAWWSAVCGVAQSRTRLKRLSSSSLRTNWAVAVLLWDWRDSTKESGCHGDSGSGRGSSWWDS